MSQKIIIPFLYKFQLSSVKSFIQHSYKQTLLRRTRIFLPINNVSRAKGGELTQKLIDKRFLTFQDSRQFILSLSLKRSFPLFSLFLLLPPSLHPPPAVRWDEKGRRGGTIVFPATCGQRRNNESPSSGASTTGCFKTNGFYLPVLLSLPPSLPPLPPSLPLPLCASSSTPPPRPTRRVYARRDGQSRLAGRRERALCA